MNHNRFSSPGTNDGKALRNIVLGHEKEGRHWETSQFSVNNKLSYTKKSQVAKKKKKIYQAQWEGRQVVDELPFRKMKDTLFLIIIYHRSYKLFLEDNLIRKSIFF